MSVADDGCENEKKKERGDGSFRKAKRVVLFRLAKLKRRLVRGGGGGCLCFMEAVRGESSFRSNTSDPNDPNLSYEMLKGMIEKNDFYSRECNPHL